MLENVKLNDPMNTIIPINAGINTKGRWVCINDNEDLGKVRLTFYGNGNCPTKIPAFSITGLINHYNIETDILKMDCEGCEYDVIINDYDGIKEFNELIFEYHASKAGINKDVLIRKLSHDFKCEVISDNEGIGIMHCIKTNMP